MNFLINDAYAAASPGGADPSGGIMNLVLLGVIFIVFYFLLIRPQTKRAKEHRKMVEALAVGDETITTGGILGRITSIGEQFMTLEVGNGVELKVQKHAVAQVLPKGTLKSV